MLHLLLHSTASLSFWCIRFFQGEREESIKELYELFASSRFWDEFSPHLQLLLIRLSDDVFSFLSYYLVYAGKFLRHLTSLIFSEGCNI